MKTKYSSLVDFKKNKMMEAEKVFIDATALLKNAEKNLALAYEELNNTQVVESGTMQEFLKSRELINAQRNLIELAKDRVNFARSQKEAHHETLKLSSIEYEKFKYVELEEIKKELEKIKQTEQKNLDEMALQSFIRQSRDDE